MVITSKDNDFVKHVKKLKEKKYRDKYNEFLFEVQKMIEDALSEKAKLKKVIVC